MFTKWKKWTSLALAAALSIGAPSYAHADDFSVISSSSTDANMNASENTEGTTEISSDAASAASPAQAEEKGTPSDASVDDAATFSQGTVTDEDSDTADDQNPGQKEDTDVDAVTTAQPAAAPRARASIMRAASTTTGRLVIHANGGTGDRTTTAILYGASDKIDPMPTKTGDTLTGLYTAASGGTKVVNADGTMTNDGTYSKNDAWLLNSDIDVYAQWTSNSYYFDLNGYYDGAIQLNIIGLGTADVYVNGEKVLDDTDDCWATWHYGSTYEIKDIKAATGYTYDGVWGSGTYERGVYYRDLTGKIGDGVVGVALAFHMNTYTVKFDANGGTGTMTDEAYKYNENKALSANTFTRKGYTFLGWSSDKNATAAQYTDKQSVEKLTSKDKDTVTLYAVWKAHVGTVTYNANGGVIGTTSKSGWSISKDGTILLDGKIDHSLNGQVDDGIVVYGSKYDLINTDNQSWLNLSRTGYHIKLGAQWNTRADGTGTSFEQDTEYTAQQFIPALETTNNATATVYANWVPNAYDIVFDANTGTGTMSNESMTYDMAKALATNAYTKKGYTFTGWNTKADGSGTKYTDKESVKNLAESGTVTLYAQWKANSYRVTYDANGGTGTMADSTAIYGQNFVTSKNMFNRKGYTFNGWNEKADGSGTAWGLNSDGVYENGNGTRPWTWTYTGNITLYAQWMANTYTVTIPTAISYANMPTGKVDVNTSFNISVECKTGSFADTIEVSSAATQMIPKGGGNSLTATSKSSQTPLTFTSAGTKQDQVAITGTANTADVWTGAVQYTVTKK